MEWFLLTLVLAGIVSMDTTAGPQFLVSEPLLSCTIAGCIFGDVETGLLLGLLFQMLWIGYLPLGTTKFTDNNLGSLIAVSSFLAAEQYFGYSESMMKACILPTMLFGSLVSIIGMHARTLVRRINGNTTEKYLQALENSNRVSIAKIHYRGIITSFLKGVVMALVFVPIGMGILGTLPYLPIPFTTASGIGAQFIVGAIAASALYCYVKRKQYSLMSLGAAGGIVWAFMTIR